MQGRPEGQPAQRPQAEQYAITPDYFKTMGSTLLAGRDFNAGDAPHAPKVAVVNESFERRYFADGRALGKHLTKFESRPTKPSTVATSSVVTV